ncbi:glycoside hydrolase family 43 protein [Bacillus sp. FJAT-50079]|uniref:glycoside hydrolase family 43 protein n=1 Tax=Bacillus sp. FJAT-50079 TaxID=2833577 RepID=UPI001BC98E7D|nr:glycoside hydrolase family 43 protein [Bacillus sp. FJAT-50079]MBS4207845.1 glycoside hydrolase family 43 protein [Bacillus sp. FJAT-50079]
MPTFKNPIISGCYADPSICRVGEDYYLITSTFEYFPGVPIFHSKDLVHWRQIGHVLDRPSQLNLDGTPNSKGIYAATIRYYNGLFYMITTFVESVTGARRNFFVTAENPEGPWSDPYWLDDCPGIDSSLFFDDDGKVYVTANRRPPSGQQYPKHMEIWMQELDLETKQLVGEKYSLWDGALKYIHAQEAPHLYKVNGMYYLIIAEGGTGFTHSVTIARSESITGPYEGAKTNPILTHRHLGGNYPIVNIGHADIVETQNGEWWMVCLGSRPYGGDFCNLGRESFLVPFVWENGWPVVNPGKGIVEMEGIRPNLEKKRWPSEPVCDHFDSETLGFQWNFIRTPRGEFWSLTERPGYLRLYAKRETITDVVNPSFIGRRQQHIDFSVRTKMDFRPENKDEAAGLVLLQNQNFQYRLEYVEANIQLVKRVDGIEEVLSSIPYEGEQVYYKVEAYGQSYNFYFADHAEEWQIVYEHADGRILSTEVAGGFVGTYIGMYATSNGSTSENYADFDYFEYVGLN